jgi:hypothetical protein
MIDITDDVNAKEVLADLLNSYLTPAFGALPKKEIDIKMFQILQKVGYIANNPEIFDLLSNLKISRAKARNLLYEVKMREASEEDLKVELKGILSSATFLADNDKVMIEISNLFLKDYVKQILKKNNIITDDSFSTELIKMPPKAYLLLVATYCDEKFIKELKSELKKCGIKVGNSIVDMLLNNSKLGGRIVDVASNLLIANIPEIIKLLS